MRRAGKNIFEFGPFRLDAVERKLLRGGRPIVLPAKVFDILLLLVERDGALVTKEELRRHIWQEQFVGENNLTVRMSALRKALGEKRGEHLYIETVPGEGYRFVARVRSLAGERAETLAAAATNERRGITSLAVLPLVNESGGQDLEYLSEGVTEGVINTLSRIAQLRVMTRNTVFRFKGDWNNPISAGRKMGVDAVVAGRVVHLGEWLLIGVELVDVREGAHLWGKTYKLPFSEILETHEKITNEIAQKLSLRLTDEEEVSLKKLPTVNTEAYRLYLKGRYFWNMRTPEGIKKAINHFEEAVTLDEGYALAYVGLADSYEGLNVWHELPRGMVDPLSRKYVTKAIEIDDSLPDAYAALGIIELHNWNWEAAEKNFKFALRLQPYHVETLRRLSIYLTSMGRFEEAVASLKLAQSTDPYSHRIGTQLGNIYHFMGRYEQAVGCCDDVIELSPDFPVAYGIKGVIYARTGRCEAAVQLLKKTDRLLGGDYESRALLGYAYGMWGKRKEALALLDELQSEARRKYVPPFLMAYVCSGLKETEKALGWLEEAYQERSYSLMNLKVDPIYEHLRPEKRFNDLLRRVGLTH